MRKGSFRVPSFFLVVIAFSLALQYPPSLRLPSMLAASSLLALVWWACAIRIIQFVQASVTVYGVSGQLQQTLGLDGGGTTSASTTADIPAYTPPAFNTVVLQAPPVPQPPPPTAFSLSLQASTGAGVQGLSIPQSGSFLGFSVEFSVVNQVGEPAPRLHNQTRLLTTRLQWGSTRK